MGIRRASPTQHTATPLSLVMSVVPEPPASSALLCAPLLGSSNEFKIAQTMKGCFQEWCGCEANSQFNFLVNGQHIGMIEEQSSCCMRFCCGRYRSWNTKMTASQNIEDPAILTFHRPFACMPGSFKCCCFQQVKVMGGVEGGGDVGRVTETCWYCIPNYQTQKPGNVPEFDIHMPTCMGGMCVNVCAEGFCNCKIPFYIYPAEHRQFWWAGWAATEGSDYKDLDWFSTGTVL